MDQKYFCQACNGLRNHNQLYEKKIPGAEEDYNFQWINKYQVIECAGCENISFLKTYGDNFMMRQDENGEMEYYEKDDIYPPYLKIGEELKSIQQIPETIRNLYKETINAFKVDSLLLAAGGFRAIIEAICNHLKIQKANLETRINLLFEGGHLTKSESRRLHSVRFLGNNALHEIETPKPEQLDILIRIINHLLSNLFINDKLIKGKLDIPLDSYSEFTNVIPRLIKKEMLEKEISLEDILGKTKRLISAKDYKTFKNTFVSEVMDGKHESLQVVDADKATFKILSIFKPVNSWDFDF